MDTTGSAVWYFSFNLVKGLEILFAETTDLSRVESQSRPSG